MEISGVKFYWKKSHMSQRSLAQAAGLPMETLRLMCELDKEGTTVASNYIALSRPLGVSVEELLARHDDSELGDGDRTVFKSKARPANCVEVYRRVHHLSYQQLSQRLGLDNRQSSHDCCTRPVPRPKHVRILAAAEGLSPEEFREKYSCETWTGEEDDLFTTL